MGNTQVTPIRPAIPPLINLAGKLVKTVTAEEEHSQDDEESTDRGESDERLHIRPHLICLSAIYVQPRLVKVSVCVGGRSSWCSGVSSPRWDDVV